VTFTILKITTNAFYLECSPALEKEGDIQSLMKRFLVLGAYGEALTPSDANTIIATMERSIPANNNHIM